ncbi:MAG: hydrogenase nickel incorporation protein HypB [Thermodesulfobacteria bacterium]|nr:hydrogenase nickel incorporation protein HypB [Thermodesulfobacteriota bacterium]
MCETCGCQTQGSSDGKVVEVNRKLLEANNLTAQENRKHFDKMGVVAINLISSPGAGKTTLLEKTAELADGQLDFAVIEGDIETQRDAERIRAKGIPAVQITTGGACHLDARLVHKGIHLLEGEMNKHGADVIFIENVGNLVCPAAFDLGEHKRVVMVSVPEGSDKPSKYPTAFMRADLFIITKIDLLPYFDFSVDEAISSAKAINPNLDTITLSAVSGEGMDEWLSFLQGLVETR